MSAERSSGLQATVAFAKPRPSSRAIALDISNAHIKSFEWREICVWTTGSSVSKQLLLDACGSTSVGEFLAILGPSGTSLCLFAEFKTFLRSWRTGTAKCHPLHVYTGAGKSTLLDVIAGRLTNLKATGQCLINNARTSFQTLAANASFVAQVTSCSSDLIRCHGGERVCIPASKGTA